MNIYAKDIEYTKLLSFTLYKIISHVDLHNSLASLLIGSNTDLRDL